MSVSQAKLFTPIQIGNLALKHRVVLAPLTRYRANKEHVHGDLAVEYYSQRASTPGTLLITEATFIANEAGGYNNVPGIWSQDQIKGWKRVTDAVHAKGSFIALQLWALGRQADPEILKERGFPYISSSNVPLPGKPVPRPLTIEEISKYVGLYRQAAINAVDAGFDLVEIHGANGYLIDQFIQDVSNKRTDEYGGSIENRAKFALEVAKAVTEAIGEERTGIRLSPWSTFGGMREEKPIPTFSYVISELNKRFPNFAYLHLVESGVAGNANQDEPQDLNKYLRPLWQPKPLIVAGRYQPETAIRTVEERDGLVAFGRWFISNPDLPRRIENNWELTPYNTKTFYTPEKAHGYIDYPFYGEQEQPESRL